MIYLRISDLLLSPPVTQISTDWQVATDRQFTAITASSIGDTVNLSAILIDVRLDPAIPYYARSRVLLSTGYTAWSNIDIFTPSSVSDASINAPIPCLVSLPSITMSGGVSNVGLIGSYIDITGVSTTTGSAHLSTTYVIESMTGMPVWNVDKEVPGKTHMLIPANVLQPGTAYRLRVMLHTDSNDTSQIITVTFKTESRTSGLVLNTLGNVSPNTNMAINVSIATGVTSSTGSLYAITSGVSRLVGTYAGTGVNGSVITIPAADLHPVTKYLLRVNTSDPSIWEQMVFVTTP